MVFLSGTINPAFLSLGAVQEGVFVTYIGCKTTFPLTVATLQYFGTGTSPACSYIDVVGDPDSDSGQVEIVDCNSIIHTGCGGRLTVNGDGSCACGVQNGGPVQATILTTPPGLGVTVDGMSYTAPASFPWDAGEMHTVSVDSVQVRPDSQLVFSHWSDGGARTHDITMPPGSVSFRATYDLLLAAPQITEIKDVPDDQGGVVNVSWRAPYTDDPLATNPIAEYVVYRSSAVPGGPPATYDSVVAVPAAAASQYTTDVPTLVDSTAWFGTWQTRLFVRARTSLDSLFYDSSIDSGYSVDNIPPGEPQSFTVSYNVPEGTKLTWKNPTDQDFVSTSVYRSTDPDFVPGVANRVNFVGDSTWVDNIADAYLYSYKIAAVDDAGNESSPISPTLVTGVEGSRVPNAVTLFQNAPNPFNPTTRIDFALPSPEFAEVLIFDVQGRLVRRLYSGRAPQGLTSVRWNGDNDHGQSVGSGVYFYRLRAGKDVLTKKMVLLK
jgi:hypothetical protein